MSPARRLRRPDLERPVCLICRRGLDPFGNCKRRTCAGYFKTWAGDQARMIRESIRSMGPCDLITVTGPGAEQLPWDTARCTHAAGVKCSGTRGCVIDRQALDAFHADYWDRWDQLWRAARSALYRRGHLMPRYVIAPELQERGALHHHLAIATTDRTAGFRLHYELRRLAPLYGFGQQIDWEPARARGEDAPGLGVYIAKLMRYVMKESQGEANGLREMLAAVPGRRLYRHSVKVTRDTRCTMRNLRLVRFFYWHVGAGRDVLGPATCEALWPSWQEQQLGHAKGERGPPNLTEAIEAARALGTLPSS